MIIKKIFFLPMLLLSIIFLLYKIFLSEYRQEIILGLSIKRDDTIDELFEELDTIIGDRFSLMFCIIFWILTLINFL